MVVFRLGIAVRSELEGVPNELTTGILNANMELSERDKIGNNPTKKK
jgi:hypothetical protein